MNHHDFQGSALCGSTLGWTLASAKVTCKRCLKKAHDAVELAEAFTQLVALGRRVLGKARR